MAGKVQHGQHPPAQVDPVAVIEHPVQGHGCDAVAGRVVAGTGKGVEHELRDGFSRWVDPEFVVELRAVQARRYARREDLGLGGVGGSVSELGCSTDVVKVRVGEQDHRIAVEQAGERLPQGDDTEPGVDHQVTVGAAQPPEVRGHQLVDVRLRDADDAVTHVGLCMPVDHARQCASAIPEPLPAASHPQDSVEDLPSVYI
ncbi:hypothetical protein HNR22_000148 [Micromonospora jinlongensis]|uniref:Uncharacterized protein n=1 Tax=Micromonospora jinlongensis TaxID=1287877 RepID=A0A7Z0BB36_9ACTN|nr:hypothetical protein [Micromonospora jinlongensis]NYH40421.1 hypothetical protein [Micromonospora jinlongensis]